MTKTTKTLVGGGVGLFLILIFILIGGMPFVEVPKGHVGVKTRFGKVSEQELPSGLRFKIPIIEKVQNVDYRQKTVREQSQASSKDLQSVVTEIKVLYSLLGSKIPVGIAGIGDRDTIAATIIDPAIQECFKSVTAKYTAEELITKRDQVSIDINQALDTFITRSLGSLNGLVIVDNVSVTNFQFSKEFDASIEAKVRAEQDALRAENEKRSVVTKAEAEKEKAILEAEAKAALIEKESIARAEAITREGEALRVNPAVIELRKIETWDGKLPHFNGGGVIPFINVDSQPPTN